MLQKQRERILSEFEIHLMRDYTACPHCSALTPYNDELMVNHCNSCRREITEEDIYGKEED